MPIRAFEQDEDENPLNKDFRWPAYLLISLLVLYQFLHYNYANSQKHETMNRSLQDKIWTFLNCSPGTVVSLLWIEGQGNSPLTPYFEMGQIRVLFGYNGCLRLTMVINKLHNSIEGLLGGNNPIVRGKSPPSPRPEGNETGTNENQRWHLRNRQYMTSN